MNVMSQAYTNTILEVLQAKSGQVLEVVLSLAKEVHHRARQFAKLKRVFP